MDEKRALKHTALPEKTCLAGADRIAKVITHRRCSRVLPLLSSKLRKPFSQRFAACLAKVRSALCLDITIGRGVGNAGRYDTG